MAKEQNPKRKGSQKISVNAKKKWQDLIESIDKKEVPVEILQKILVTLIDSTQVTIDVQQFLKEGMEPFEVEDMLNQKFQDLDDYIANVDFFVDIDSVVGTIQPETDRILSNL